MGRVTWVGKTRAFARPITSTPTIPSSEALSVLRSIAPSSVYHEKIGQITFLFPRRNRRKTTSIIMAKSLGSFGSCIR